MEILIFNPRSGGKISILPSKEVNANGQAGIMSGVPGSLSGPGNSQEAEETCHRVQESF